MLAAAPAHHVRSALPLELAFELSYLDLCRLSQAFNRDANLAEPGDYKINEWLKQEIARRTIKVERV